MSALNSVALSESVVVFHHARFTVLTERMIRMEWAEDGVFEDLLTLTVSNRCLEPVPFRQSVKGKTLTVRTGALVLEYTETGRPFSRSNLSVTLTLNGKAVRWVPGKRDAGNLKGTAKTLDGVDGSVQKHWRSLEQKDPDKPVLAASSSGDWIWQGDMEPLALCDGLISRSGWAVVDDSTSPVLDPALCDWQAFPRERAAGERRDLYFLGYGHDYKAAVRDGAKVFGAQPLPPRYALGYWYSRYWAYTDKELKQLVEDFDRMDLPLDVLVIDMDWHKMGWTGYTWDPDFFPDPKALLAWLRKRGIKITLNLHPADGVFDFEDAFPAMLKAMGLNREDLPDLEPHFHGLYELMGLDPKTAKRIPLNINDPNYMRPYFKCLHHPQEKIGVDFWWMDWQQGRGGSQLPNLDTLPWINELHWQDQVRHHPERRPINFSRFGGIGAGRMPVGFSGDTIVTWDSLAYQPYFTATAANVLYGYWSHDIGGHMGGELTPELYARWLQFGMYSPILRTHTSKALECERRVFHFPDPARSVMMGALRRRYELVPYVYGEMRTCAETGLSLIRPMYYEYPEAGEAYRCPNQYMFGDEMIVAPVVAPVDAERETAAVKVWLPEGEWVDTARGVMVEGGGWRSARYTLEEVPVFVRPGTVIPEQSFTRRLKGGSYPNLVFRVYGGKEGGCEVYEDDGESTGWRKDECAVIRFHHKKVRNTRTLTLEAASGDFKGFKARRPVTVLLEGMAPPKGVEGAVSWRYDGDTATLALNLGRCDLNRGTGVTVTESGDAAGLKGMMTRLEKARAYVCQVSPARPFHAEERLAVRAAQTGNRISLNPDTFASERARLEADARRLPAALREYAAVFRSKGPALEVQAAALDRARGLAEAVVADFL
jgi:alpha-glucosidase (family GH31 glycosyl hydrolase)